MIVMDRHLRCWQVPFHNKQAGSRAGIQLGLLLSAGKASKALGLRRWLSALTYVKANLQSLVDVESARAHGGSVCVFAPGTDVCYQNQCTHPRRDQSPPTRAAAVAEGVLLAAADAALTKGLNACINPSCVLRRVRQPARPSAADAALTKGFESLCKP